jgi:release factor glutamine methyltransferase
MSVPTRTDPKPSADAWTIGALLNWTAQHLSRKGSEYPRLDAEVLLAHALGCRRIDLYTRFTEEAPEEARNHFRDLVRQRVEGCPVAYLVGRKEFFALDLEVNRDVLIPRPESEFVVMECLRLARAMPEPCVLDIGTGSGNIAVAVAQQHKGARVTAVDLSPAALAIAGRNAARHGVAGRVDFVAGDLFTPLDAGRRFDFILSNPPYIPRPDIPQLPVGVRDYEPHLALDGGPLGYTVFDRLIDQAREHLQAGGYLIVEIGAPQEQEARRRIAGYAGYELAPTVHDYSGHPRVLRARWQPSHAEAPVAGSAKGG